MVLFTGTPCQIGGLLSYLRKDYDNLITQDLICHGVSSPIVWQRYIEYRVKKAKAIRPLEISFRAKHNGWKRFEMFFIFDNANKYRKYHHEDYMMQAFLQDMCLRESCYKCSFRKYNRQSDFTLADFWGIENIEKGFNDDKGVSLVIIHSEKGRKLFEQIADSGDTVAVDLDTALSQNKSMVCSPIRPENRDDFMSAVSTTEFDILVKSYCKQENFKMLRKIKRKILSVIEKI